MVIDHRKLILAVDGGQSSTLALIADLDGNVLAYGKGGPSNHYNEPGGPERLDSALRTSTTEALHTAGVSADAIAHVCLGMTGVHPQAQVITQSLFPNAAIQLFHDAITALAGASVAQPGIVVIGGTGVVAYGRLASGEEARASGWGYIIGDEGSGYWIGVEAIRAACRADDKRGASTILNQQILNHFQLPDLRALHRKLYAQEISRKEVAALSAVTANAALKGDSVAVHLLERAGQELAQAVLAVITHLGQLESGQPIYYTGGVFYAGNLILDSFEEAVRMRSPRSTIQAAAFSPAVGTLLLALRTAKVELTEHIIEQIRHTIPVDAHLKQPQTD